MSDLANLARSLHRKQGLTPEQIRNRSGFLDSNYDPCIPIATIQSWLVEEDAGAAAAALPRQASISPSNTPPRAVAHLDRIQQVEDHRALHDKVARLEAQLNRLSFERASRTPSPARSFQVSPERSRSRSPFVEQRDNNQEMFDQLKQMNTQLMDLVTATLGAVTCRDSASPASPAAVKPFKDWLPQVKSYSGETDRTPEAFLDQYYLYVRQQNVPASERTRQLIGKLTGPAQSWYTLTFANDPAAATESQIALGLRKTFGQEYAGVRALRAIYQVHPLPTQSGAQRLLALDHREEQARQHRVPRDAGPFETRFSRVLALFFPRSSIASLESSRPTPAAPKRPYASSRRRQLSLRPLTTRARLACADLPGPGDPVRRPGPAGRGPPAHSGPFIGSHAGPPGQDRGVHGAPPRPLT